MKEINAGSLTELGEEVVNGAMARKANVVRLQPTKTGMVVTEMGKKGNSRTVGKINRRLAWAIATRFKIMANLPISEHRRVQVGSIDISLGDESGKIRVIIVPCPQREEVILDFADVDFI